MHLHLLGTNSFGQLGLPPSDKQPSVCINLPPELDNIQQIYTCANHTIIKTLSNNRIQYYGCGDNRFGQLDPHNRDEMFIGLKKLAYLENMEPELISLGMDFTVVIRGNKVLSFGNNIFGQLGDSEDKKLLKSELKLALKENERVVQLSSGARFTILLTDLGRVFGFGCNRFGQLGYDTGKKSCGLVKLPLSNKIKVIQCGFEHTVFLDEFNQLSGFGRNKFKQLGDELLTNHELKQLNIDPLKDVHLKYFNNNDNTILRSGFYHHLMLIPNRLLGLGRNVHQELITSTSDSTSISQPIELPLPSTIVSDQIETIYCGSHSTLLLTKDKKLFGRGWNEHYNISHEEKICSDWYFIDEKIKLVGCGWAYVWLLIED